MQKAFIAAVATATIGAGTIGIGSAFAAETGTHPKLDNLMQAIATKFNLKTDEVQRVFDEQRALGQAERKTEFEQHAADVLAKAVTDGKLTQTQADALIAKRAEIEANKPDLTGKTPAEIRAALKTQHEAVQAWAKENGIPENFIFRGAPFAGRGDRPMGGRGMMGGAGMFQLNNK